MSPSGPLSLSLSLSLSACLPARASGVRGDLLEGGVPLRTEHAWLLRVQRHDLAVKHGVEVILAGAAREREGLGGRQVLGVVDREVGEVGVEDGARLLAARGVCEVALVHDHHRHLRRQQRRPQLHWRLARLLGLGALDDFEAAVLEEPLGHEERGSAPGEPSSALVRHQRLRLLIGGGGAAGSRGFGAQHALELLVEVLEPALEVAGVDAAHVSAEQRVQAQVEGEGPEVEGLVEVDELGVVEAQQRLPAPCSLLPLRHAVWVGEILHREKHHHQIAAWHLLAAVRQPLSGTLLRALNQRISTV
mmetsp:Transcript_23550/g.56214  ORF Transcript_23550/g.56214 Transcript_23550/m.56214 type:complete len:305 (+) Transcript_23550:1521-2435(+)